VNSVKVVGRMLCWLTHRRENSERLLSRGKTVLMHRLRVYRVSYCPRQIAYNAVRMHIASYINFHESIAKVC